jgi:hypothetical protein
MTIEVAAAQQASFDSELLDRIVHGDRLDTYSVAELQKTELHKIYGDRAWPTIEYLSPGERVSIIGRLALAYEYEVPRSATETNDRRLRSDREQNARKWRAHLHGTPLVTLAAESEISKAAMYGRFYRITNDLRHLNLSFKDLVLDAGGEMIPTMTAQEYYRGFGNRQPLR